MSPIACHHPATLPILGSITFALAVTFGPSASALIEILQPLPDELPRIADSTRRPRLRLAEAWSPPVPTFWTSDDGSIRGDALPSLGDVVDRFLTSGSLDIPDGSAVGVASEKTVTGLSGVITRVDVEIHLAPRGDQPLFNGDLFVTLSHDSGYAVLLNRTGRRDGFSAGYGDSGFNITLSDLASADVHNYRVQATGSHTTPLSLTEDPAALTGTWQPDGRSTDPSLVLATSPRDALLSQFVGMNPNGVWTLFVADLNPNGLGQLVQWSLVLTTVPEPSETLAVVALGLSLFAFARRQRTR